MVIRAISPSDADAAARLSGELGYRCEMNCMRERITKLLSSNDRMVYVACVGDAVIAWIDVGIVHHLATGAYGEIGGFVVSAEHRGRGIGRELLREAENWIANKGVSKMVVRSRTTREAAHRFYLREGYLITKTSSVFSKELPTISESQR